MLHFNHKQFYSLIKVAFVFICHYNVSSQSLGTWQTLQVKYKFNQNLSLLAEAQLRSLKFYDNFHYHEFKGGVEFKPNKLIRVALAAGKYDTYNESGNFSEPKNVSEFRLWPQVITHQDFGNFEVEHRYRIEARFTNKGYRNRFRYRFSISQPILKSSDGNKVIIDTGLSNELFFTTTEPYFERNRAQYFINFSVSETVKIQTAYLYQFDYKINDETGRDFIQIGIYFNFHNQKS